MLMCIKKKKKRSIFGLIPVLSPFVSNYCSLYILIMIIFIIHWVLSLCQALSEAHLIITTIIWWSYWYISALFLQLTWDSVLNLRLYLLSVLLSWFSFQHFGVSSLKYIVFYLFKNIKTHNEVISSQKMCIFSFNSQKSRQPE